ncbi:MAG: acyl-CoA thioesterase [Deltaproteobacteria bacterium]|nr:acyl-CoA thioesterase [Deltaproteobacteria bacterium]
MFVKKSVTEYRVIFADIDSMGVVYYSHYLDWFERGRTEFFREMDLPYTEVVKHGIVTPVSEVYCRYHKSAQYDDVVQIETTVSSFKRVTIVFDYEIYRKDDRTLLVSGYTKHGFLDLNGKIVKIPSFISEKIKSLME